MHDDDEWLFPWFRALFHAEEPIDLVFNMGLLAFFADAGLRLPLFNRTWRRKHHAPITSGWSRSIRIYVLVTACVSRGLHFGQRATARPLSQPGLCRRTDDARQYAMRSWYAPIPFGPTKRTSTRASGRPCIANRSLEWTRSSDRFPHLLGTDNTGRDVLVEMLYGTRISLTVGFIAVGLYLTIGSVIGAMAGYFGGAIDTVVSRLLEIVLLFPSFFLDFDSGGRDGPEHLHDHVRDRHHGLAEHCPAGAGGSAQAALARLCGRGPGLGTENRRILLRHVLPNSLSPVMVAAPFGVAGAIIAEAGLSLLGFGVRPPTPSWGALLQLGSGNYSYWWLVVVPSLAIFATVTMFNVAGNAPARRDGSAAAADRPIGDSV